MNKMIKKSTYFLVALGIIIIDRATKLAALSWCLSSEYLINSYLSYAVVFNRGVSWGMFHSTREIGFILVSLTIALITGILAWHAYGCWRSGKIILGHLCIVTGSLCNLADRLIYSGVVDFIILSYKDYSWPVFNIADVAIVCGVCLVILLDEL